jgi:tRNA(fMet)-specific endonuclease VapC
VGFLIDTSVLIAAERERFSLTDLMASLGEEPQALAAITASELLHGVHRAKDAAVRERRLRFVEFMLDLFPEPG